VLELFDYDLGTSVDYMGVRLSCMSLLFCWYEPPYLPLVGRAVEKEHDKKWQLEKSDGQNGSIYTARVAEKKGKILFP
jgi:hypothetical protein